jgi:hypothetical protein
LHVGSHRQAPSQPNGHDQYPSKPAERALIDQAAAAQGKSRSDFMLEASRPAAEGSTAPYEGRLGDLCTVCRAARCAAANRALASSLPLVAATETRRLEFPMQLNASPRYSSIPVAGLVADETTVTWIKCSWLSRLWIV